MWEGGVITLRSSSSIFGCRAKVSTKICGCFNIKNWPKVIKEEAELSKFMVGLSATKGVKGNIDHNYTKTQVKMIKGMKFFLINDNMTPNFQKNKTVLDNIIIIDCDDHKMFKIFSHLFLPYRCVQKCWVRVDYFFGLCRQINSGTDSH